MMTLSTVLMQCRSDLLKVGQVSAKDKGPWQESFEKACLSTLKVALPDKAGLCGILFCQAMPKMRLCAICFVWQKAAACEKKKLHCNEKGRQSCRPDTSDQSNHRAHCRDGL